MLKLASLKQFVLRQYYSRVHHIEFGRGAKIWGRPILRIKRGGRLILKSNSLLNSYRTGYFLNMYSPVKICIEEAGQIEIGSDTRVHGSCIRSHLSVKIGNRCLIAANCQIFDSNGHDLNFDDVAERIETHGSSRPVWIEDCVWLGLGVIVLPGTHIGHGTVVAAGSVVKGDVPPMCVVAGNPAQVVKRHPC